jgi:hypothetical protein
MTRELIRSLVFVYTSNKYILCSHHLYIYTEVQTLKDIHDKEIGDLKKMIKPDEELRIWRPSLKVTDKG